MSDSPSADDLKHESMALVDAHASERWKRAAEIAVIGAARSLEFLTSDDVMERIDPAAHTHELRALGPVMLRAAKSHWIAKSHEPAKNSARRSLHASPRTVWRSLIFDPIYRLGNT